MSIPYTDHKYRVVPYSAAWPERYRREAIVLSEIFGSLALDIQHVGSTAIPGMAAKPRLDILVQVKSIDQANQIEDELVAAGYVAYGDLLGKGGRLYSRWKDGEKTVNLHVFQSEAHAVWEYLAVRDYLLTHPEEARKYADLKLELYQKYPDDYLKYREVKDPWLEKLKERIKKQN